MMELVAPDAAYKAALLEAAAEMHAIGEWELTPEALEAHFDTLLQELAAARDPATAPTGVLPYEDFWLLDDGVWIGLLTLRPQIDAALMRSGGHIGYVVRPSRRRQGYGTVLLRLGLQRAREHGLQRVLLTCADTNVGSRKVIEANGGQLQDVIVVDPVASPVRRYWIALSADTS